jgi:hypothetical protein
MLPAASHGSTPTLLYVHSASNDAQIAQELEVVKSAVGATMGILFVRGSESECALSADVKAARCWPQPDDESSSRRIWERWDKVQWQAEALLPEGTHPRLVIGFKEGAAFAARAFKRGAIQATMAAAVAPATLESGNYPSWLVGIGIPASAESVFSSGSTASATCPRDGGAALTDRDLKMASDVFHVVSHRSGKDGAKGPATPCTVHPARPSRP